ncbi:MAG: hypothetical protein JXL81_05330 [Deltaproteobacteria bacterium]|nr:hypothetical protein [Deltaproteobacteria bacterium]
MILSFHPCITADHQIILGNRQPDLRDEPYISKAELIILPQTCSEKLFLMCAESGGSLFPDYRVRFDYQGKSGQSLLFKETGLPHPKTLQWNSVDHCISAFDNGTLHDYPFLIKEDRSHEAEGIHIIRNADDIEISMNKILKRHNTGDTRFISQEFIHADGNTLRVVIMGESYIPYWKRAGVQGQVISSISKGAIVDKKWRPDLQQKGIFLAEKLSVKTGINLAAVDFIFNLKEQDPEPLILEINYYFGRKGLGGTIKYYRLLFRALSGWMEKNQYDSSKIKLV